MTVALQTTLDGIARGLERGFPVTKRKRKRNRRIAKNGTKRKLIQEVIKETVGYSPYEKRIMDLIRLGKQKRALKLAKQRLGTHQRAKKKRAELEAVLMG